MRIPVVALLAISAALCPAQDRLAETLRKGIVQEETRQDLNEAIKSYEAVLAQFGQISKPGASDRKTAATALFRIAECYRKQGRAEQAAAAYRRIVNEFGDQEQLVAQSRTHIKGSEVPSDTAAARQDDRMLTVTIGKSLALDSSLPIDRVTVADGNLADAVAINPQKVQISGKAPGETTLVVWQRGGSRLVYELTVTVSPVRLDAARQQLVDKARKTLEAHRYYVTKQYQLGAISQLDLQDAQKKFLERERQLAAYEAGLVKPVSDEARNRYRAILVEQIRLARTAMDTAKKRYDLGETDIYPVFGAESALSDLELELATFDASQGESTGKR